MAKQRGLAKITLKPDEKLAEILGTDKEMNITEYPKRMWSYFYANQLVFKEGKPLIKK